MNYKSRRSRTRRTRTRRSRTRRSRTRRSRTRRTRTRTRRNRTRKSKKGSSLGREDVKYHPDLSITATPGRLSNRTKMRGKKDIK